MQLRLITLLLVAVCSLPNTRASDGCASNEYKDWKGTCQTISVSTFKFVLKFDVVVTDDDLNDQTLKDNLKTELEAKMSVPGLQDVRVTGLRKGSLIVDAEADVDSTNTNPSVSMATALPSLLGKEFTIKGQKASVSGLQVGSTKVTSNTPAKCEILKALAPCSARQYCALKNDVAVCRTNSSGDDDLTLGLAVGIPLFILLLTFIVVLTCVYIHNQKAKKQLSFDDEDVNTDFHKALAGDLPVRSPWRRDEEQGEYVSYDNFYGTTEPDRQEFRIQRPKFDLNASTSEG